MSEDMQVEPSQQEQTEPKTGRKPPPAGAGIAIGICLGAGVGLPLGNPLLGLGVGLAFAAAFESAFRRQREENPS
ncbi:MAG: hypothetical protein PVG63_05545 [Anaerolineales bacterium]|jgi:hypothetical protein